MQCAPFGKIAAGLNGDASDGLFDHFAWVGDFLIGAVVAEGDGVDVQLLKGIVELSDGTLVLDAVFLLQLFQGGVQAVAVAGLAHQKLHLLFFLFLQVGVLDVVDRFHKGPVGAGAGEQLLEVFLQDRPHRLITGFQHGVQVVLTIQMQFLQECVPFEADLDSQDFLAA